MDKRLRLFLILLLVSACSKKNSEGFVTKASTNTGLTCQTTDEIGSRAIYGNDNRLDWFASPGLTKNYWAKATVALIDGAYLVDQTDYQEVSALTYQDAVGLCPGNPFGQQPSAAFCSGFLVSPDLIVTAGHCIRDIGDCIQTRFIFDYAKTAADQKDYRIPNASVYSCKEIVERKTGANDFALIRLDRPVADRTPLNIRRSGVVAVGEQVMLIGHPLGLPSKIADGGFIQSSGDKIIATVDAFAANSGSVILNSRTGLVEGLLVAGETDFQSINGCRVEAHCDANCTGEVITPISKLMHLIPNTIYDNPICD